jgi:UDP-glucose 4-epimerase
MRAIITGSKGFLGKYIVYELQKRKIEVVEYDVTDGNNIKDYDNLLEKTRGCDYFIHLAAVADIGYCKSHPIEAFDINLLGTIQCLEAAKYNHIKKFVFASTVYVSGRYGSFYKISKLAGEELCKEYNSLYGLDYVVTRYGSLYGPGANEWNRISDICRTLMNSDTYYFDGTPDERREFIHVEDASRITVDVTLSENYLNKPVLITGCAAITTESLFKIVEEMLGKKINVVYVDNPDRYQHYKTTPYSFVLEPVTRVNAEQSIDFGEGLLQCIKECHYEREEHNNSNGTERAE